MGPAAAGSADGGGGMSYIARNHPQQVHMRGALDPVDDRTTDPELLARLNAQYRFTVDVAASAENMQCPRYFDKEADGLRQPWAGETVWCNPPYSDIRPWVAKAWAEPTAHIVMLLPANRTEQGWWQDLVEPERDRIGSRLTVQFLRGRLRFIRAGGDSIGTNERPPFGCCLLIWSAVRDG